MMIVVPPLKCTILFINFDTSCSYTNVNTRGLPYKSVMGFDADMKCRYIERMKKVMKIDWQKTKKQKLLQEKTIIRMEHM